jgi:hypothetical protein
MKTIKGYALVIEATGNKEDEYKKGQLGLYEGMIYKKKSQVKQTESTGFWKVLGVGKITIEMKG